MKTESVSFVAVTIAAVVAALFGSVVRRYEYDSFCREPKEFRMQIGPQVLDRVWSTNRFVPEYRVTNAWTRTGQMASGGWSTNKYW